MLTMTSNYWLHQLIPKLAHILDLPSSCIDQIFTPQPSFVGKIGVRYKKYEDPPHINEEIKKQTFNMVAFRSESHSRTYSYALLPIVTNWIHYTECAKDTEITAHFFPLLSYPHS